jgi:glycosyltransferase involved in cell wall biosynthesis
MTVMLRAVGSPRWAAWLRRVLRIRRRVLFLEPFFPQSSGAVYRVVRWADILESRGFRTRIRHPLSERTTRKLLDGGWTGLFYAVYLLRRLPQCLAAPFYSCVVVRRELLVYNDYGDLFLERLLLALNPNVILDFDDDISAAKREPRELTPVGRALRENPTKFNDSLRLYPRFIAGSGYLAHLVELERAGLAPADTVVIPTCVDYDKLAAKQYTATNGPLTFGWIGTNGNLPQLEALVPELEALSRDVPLKLLVISGRDLGVATSFPVENRRWSLDRQIADLLDIEVGLMPLRDTRVERGKCGFKLIQYMGLGIVGVASAVTTNREIVTNGVDGFLVEPGAGWLEPLREITARREEFSRIGSAARERITSGYSFDAHSDAYTRFIERACCDEVDMHARH